jgi:hypothetical protein
LRDVEDPIEEIYRKENGQQAVEEDGALGRHGLKVSPGGHS